MCSSSSSSPSPSSRPQGAIPDSGWPPDNGLTGAHIGYHEEPCPYPPTVLDFLPLRGVDRGVVEDNWPCEVRVFWVQDMLPFVYFVRFLYSNVTLFLVLTGLLLNCFALRVLSSRAMRGTSLAVYLKALSVSDMGALFFTYCLGFLRSHHPGLNSLFLNNDSLCRMHKVLVSMFPMTSQWLQTALTLERLLVVWRPMRAPNPFFPQESVRLARKIVAGVCTVLVLVALTKWYFSGFEQYSAFEYARCDLTTHSSVEMVYVYVALSTYLPGTLIFISNVLLVLKLRRTDALRRSLFAGSVPDGATHQTDAAARTLLLFSLLYLVLQLPLGVVETVELYWDVTLYRPPPRGRDREGREAYIFWLCEKLKLKWARTLLFWLFQLSFVLNFVVYLKSASRFRAVAKALMRRWTRGSLSVPVRALQSVKKSWRGSGMSDRDPEGAGVPLPVILPAAASSSSSSTPSTTPRGSGDDGRQRLRSKPRLSSSCWRALSKAARLHTWSCTPPSQRSVSTSTSHGKLFRRRRNRLHTWSFFLRRGREVPLGPLSEGSSSSSSGTSPYSGTSTVTEMDSVFESPRSRSAPASAPSPLPESGTPLAAVAGAGAGTYLSDYGTLDSSRQDLLCDTRSSSSGSMRQLLVRFRSERHVDRLGDLQHRGRKVKFERFLSHPHRLV